MAVNFASYHHLHEILCQSKEQVYILLLSKSKLFFAAAVDASGAGEGNLEVTVTGPSGAPVTNYIRSLSIGIVGVFYTPVQSGIYLINVVFNGEVVPGACNCNRLVTY